MGDLNKFCDRMRYWCDEGDLGYDQGERWNIWEGGECDCSSLVVFALQEAGFDTGAASWTGNMSAELTARGWKRVAADGNPRKGDVLLNDASHVAVWLGDRLAQASIGEGGLVRGGQSGDQTGWETNTRSYYSYPWDCYLRWEGEPVARGNERTAQLIAPNLSTAQRVRPKKNADGTYTLLFDCKPGYALDVAGSSAKSGAVVQAWPEHGGANQKWRIERVKLKPGKASEYAPPELAPVKITPACAPKLRLSCAKEGTRLSASKAKVDNAQRWYVIDNGDGTWSLLNVKWHRFLDLADFGK